MSTKYKLVTRDGYTRKGLTGETYWLDGHEVVAVGSGSDLCTAALIHYYDDPRLAVLFNPIHANIRDPRLIEIEISEPLTHDGLKGGCKRGKFVKEIALPAIPNETVVTFAIECALRVYKDSDFVNWAQGWTSGQDRTPAAASAASAASAAWAAESVARVESAASEAASAAASAAWAAESAERAEWAAEISAFFVATIARLGSNC